MNNPPNSPAPDPILLLHGWDSTGGFWHGPTEIVATPARAASIQQKLGATSQTFHGKIRCSVPGCPSLDFQTAIYDLTDSGLAIIHSVGAPGRPIGALAVIPAQRRPRIRDEFAFGFVSFLSFLGGLVSPESDLAVHDYVDEALRSAPSGSLAFGVECEQPCTDASVVLSTYLEKLSIAMLYWLSSKEEAEREKGGGAFLLAEDGSTARKRASAA
jgi:hypothetical protein